MGSFRQLLRSRSLRLVVGLAIAVAIPVGALVLAQFRSLHDLEQTSVAVLETLSAQVADSLAQALREQLERPSYELERVDHSAVSRADQPAILARLRERGPSVPMVDAFYLWSRTGAAAGVLEVENAPALWSAPAPSFASAGDEAPRLIDLARETATSGLPWGTAVVEVGGRRQSLVVHLMFDSSARERLTSFIGFRVDLDRLRTDGLAPLLEPLTATAQRKTSLATLVIALEDHTGVEVYRSHPQQPLQVLEERRLPLLFFARSIMPSPDPCPTCLPVWTLKVGYGEGSAAAIAVAGTSGHRTLLAVLVGLLALGVVLAARTALKEMQLAEARSQFVASVSHDLRTPLALIQLFAETLELGRVKSVARAREYYGIINAEAKKLGALINNILDFSRIESGPQYRMQPVDLGALVTRIVAGLQSQAAHLGFEIVEEIAPDLPSVPADEDAVGLAVANLLSNAMKYSGDSRTVWVSVAPAGAGASVRVADRGLGIPWRHHRKIFQKFYRVSGDDPSAPRGCGLGLAIVDQVMRAHRGRVLVESEPGEGSVFTLVFPAAVEKRRDEADSRDRGRTPDAAGAA
jgi:signal transduction histidine kinase